MRAIVISGTEQEFNGKTFRLYPGERYFSRGTTRLHRKVWEFYHGVAPPGFDIHHRDEDRNNNQIENLMLLPQGAHRANHAREWHRRNPEFARNNIDKGQDKCREWHRSEKGSEWHKAHYEKTKGALYERITKPCKFCEKDFEGTKGNSNLFCSNACKAAWRRYSGVDDVTRECAHCGREFSINKYRKTKNCSKSCAAKSREVAATR